MALGDLILFAAVGYLLWKILGPKTDGQSGEGEDENQPRQLTETQKRWHELKKSNPNPESDYEDSNAERPLSDTQREWRERRNSEITREYHKNEGDRVQRTKDMESFIRQNLRPFNVWEWLYWPVELRFLGAYMIHILPILVLGILVPIMFGLPVVWWVVAGVLVYIDIRAYQRYLMFAATIWNPEWHKRFGER